MLTTIAILIGLGLLIGLHEASHMFVAKLFNVKVLKFSFGFGPLLLHKQIGETSYELRLLPLGGFVQFFGECPESRVPR
jgi:regulator of sigma E protease